MRENYKIYGSAVKEECPSEAVEMASFFSRLRREYPDTYGLLGLHIRNEGKRTAMQMRKIKADGGFVKGAVDIIIPGRPTFVCELKSQSKNARLSKEQQSYLEAAAKAGAFACVAFGASAAWDAFTEWLNAQIA